MKFCSDCGGLLEPRAAIDDTRGRLTCSRCATVQYQNPRIIVCCAVCLDDKVLMCRRALEPGRGLWAVPSGYLENGESLEQGAARETWEETGLAIDPGQLHLCSVVNMTSIEQVAIMFRLHLQTMPALAPGPESLEVAFMAARDIPIEEFAWRSTMGDGPERFYGELRSGNFTIQLITLGAFDGAGFRSREYQISSVHDTILADHGD